MQKQVKTQNKQNKVDTKANKGDKTMEKQVKPQARLEDKIYAEINKAMEQDKNIRTQKNTGHTAIKYGNKVLFEFHDKKKAISHLTFCSQEKVFNIIKEKFAKDKGYRVVPKSYGWRIDTEMLLTPELVKAFPLLLKTVIAEAVENLNNKEKQAKKQAPKKVAKAS